MTLKDHLKLFLAEFLVQLLGWKHEGLIYGALRLDTLQRHILRERRKMTTALWYRVLNHYGWQCLRCKTVNFRNSNPSKPKMEVDHVTPLFRWGLTEWRNLQVLCKPCNRWKWTKTIDFRG